MAGLTAVSNETAAAASLAAGSGGFVVAASHVAVSYGIVAAGVAGLAIVADVDSAYPSALSAARNSFNAADTVDPP